MELTGKKEALKTSLPSHPLSFPSLPYTVRVTLILALDTGLTASQWRDVVWPLHYTQIQLHQVESLSLKYHQKSQELLVELELNENMYLTNNEDGYSL